MERYLTTQERVDLAVEAGHVEKVSEYIRMHNNGDATEFETLYVLDNGGGKIVYDRLPSYGVAAVDSYLNIFDIPLRTQR